jgi:MFS family permease
MLVVAVATAMAITVVAFLFLRSQRPGDSTMNWEGETGKPLQPASRAAYAFLCFAGFLCCTPMAMPPGHLVALCSDLGIVPAQGALMLSVLLGSALISRMFWGWLTDRIGGLRTILAASSCQAAALLAFVFTQDEVGLFAVSAAFGLGFSGLIPAYVVVLRALFPAKEAAWRMPVWFFSNIIGMALGGWLAGYLYDELGSYGPAFAFGVVLNIGNIAIIGWMAARYHYA